MRVLQQFLVFNFFSLLRTFRFQGFPTKQVSKNILHLGTSLKLPRDLLSYHLAMGLPPGSFPLGPPPLLPPGRAHRGTSRVVLLLPHFLLFPAPSLVVVGALSVKNFSCQTAGEILLVRHSSS